MLFPLFSILLGEKDSKIMVADLGGGTFDVTLARNIETTEGNTAVEVMYNSGAEFMGMYTLDNMIITTVFFNIKHRRRRYRYFVD